MPRKKETIINYRPKLSKELQRVMDSTLDFYKANPIGVLYILLEKPYREKGDEQGANLLSSAAKCLLKDDSFSYEKFVRYYRDDLNKLEIGLGNIMEAGAARVVFETLSELIVQEKKKLSESNFTKMEQHMVDHFFNVLLSPTRNPNIQIPEGEVKCYYDRHYDALFKKDMKFSIEFIKKECSNTIEIFRTSDKEEEFDERDI